MYIKKKNKTKSQEGARDVSHTQTYKESGSDNAEPVEQGRRFRPSALQTDKEIAAHDKKSAQTSNMLKIAFLVFFLLTAIGVIAILIVYQAYANQAKQQEFEDQFRADAYTMLSRIGANIDSLLSATDAFAISMLSFAKATGQTYPFVTIDDFAVGAGKLLETSHAKYITTNPVVELDERKAWETYAEENNNWIFNSLEVQRKGQGSTYFGPNVTLDWVEENYAGHYNLIHDYDEAVYGYGGDSTNGVDNNGPYLPIWQSSPVIPVDPIYNWDLSSQYPIQNLLSTHQVTLTAPYLISLPDDEELKKQTEAQAEFFETFLEPGEEPLAPVFDVYYPLIPGAVDSVGYSEVDHSENEIGAILSLSIYWRDVLTDLLPPDSAGLRVIIENECNDQPFGYEIFGPSPNYLGPGDFSSSEELVIVSDLMDASDYGASASTYTGIPVNEDVCPYTITVYPAESAMRTFESSSMNTTYTVIVVILSIVVLAIVTTLMFFFFYDRLLQKQIAEKIALQQEQAKRYRNVFARRVAQTIRVRAGANQLSPELLQKQFEKMDQDNDGSISKEELWKFLTSGKAGTINESDFNSLWAVIDADDSGNVEFLEFCAFLAGCHDEYETAKDRRSVIATRASQILTSVHFTAEDLGISESFGSP